MGYYLGIDVGTSSCRAVIFDSDLRSVASASQEYDILSPHPGWAEQDPEVLLRAVVDTAARAVKKAAVDTRLIKAMGWASVMHSLIALDREKKPLTNAWTWADLRSSHESKQLRAARNDFFYRKTGCPIHPMYWPAKITYLQNQMRPVWEKTAHLVSIKEYLVHRLTGRLISDESTAAATGLLNIATLKWDEELLKELNINPAFLSPPSEPTTIVQGIDAEFAKKMGLSPDILLVIGSSDGTLSNVGSGAVKDGVMALMVGTSGAVRVLTDKPHFHPKAATWCYYLANKRWVAGAATNNGGNVLKWYRDRLADSEREQAEREGINAYEILSSYASEVPPGSRRLLFLPFLAGERCPHWNADARGVFFGLDLRHGRKEMVRAMMEGVAFQMYSIYLALSELVGEPQEIRATGGLTKSPVWLQIVADVVGKPLQITENPEGSSFGAAALAMVALGDLDSLERVYDIIGVTGSVEPNLANHQLYTELYGLYDSLYDQVTGPFAALQALATQE